MNISQKWMYARFAYITYCFKVTTPIRSLKKTLF